tara:strand:+ start:263 stop:466 length:204 start_codon:yes stop_codon:yes gene_type:complete
LIKIEDFSLAWRWISSSHGDFSKATLNKLNPLSEDQARALALPWIVFCDHWDDFCYSSNDDINLYLT